MGGMGLLEDRIECSHGVDTRPACWRCVSHLWVHGPSGTMPYYECIRFPKRLTLCECFRDKWPACVEDAAGRQALSADRSE